MKGKKSFLKLAKHLIIFSTLFFLNCSGEDPTANSLYIDPATRNFSENPNLLDRIKSSPHGYFRFINIPFSQEVCRRLSDLNSGAPSLNLHGDAHIEQYAVTDLGRGLTDFDDSCTGPGIIDLLRFGVSMQLASREADWSDKIETAFTTFLQGYKNALEDPEIIASQPNLVSRIQSTFEHDRGNYLTWVDSIMEPVAAVERDSLLIAIRPYIENMMTDDASLGKDYFEVVKLGYLRMGIGSALDLKYLIRVQGQSADTQDDVVLECKQVRDLSGIDCVNSGQKLNPFRILLGQARIAYQPFEHLGYFKFRGNNFWVHSWVDNYKEVSIGETFQSFQELLEVAYDVGVQLGRGHVKHIGAPFGMQIRRQQRELVEQNETRLKDTCRNLTRDTVSAWETFRSNLKTE